MYQPHPLLMRNLLCLLSMFVTTSVIAQPLNIIWIVIEDASPHIGCYGETAIETPTLDQMAADGIRFESAFVTAPVCSSSRSAMVSGMYQMTLGAHNHRSQTASGKGSTSEAYQDSYRLPVKLVPELFGDAGYYVTNHGKTDYNFIPKSEVYHGKDWTQAASDQPIFAQFQLRGGKNRKAEKHANPDTLTLPTYYPDHPVIQKDWATYLDSWVETDKEVASILAKLDKAGRLDSTAVFLWTDHGISHLRGKQFLYEEGIRIPLIVQLPEKEDAGLVREDIIEHIDIAATSLALAGIAIPDYLQGRDFLSDHHIPRDHLFIGRDRCDETVDIIRGIRDERFKFIRNFMSHVSHAQPNQYKDGKTIIKTLRELKSQDALTKSQAQAFLSRRPTEELYDLKNDPYELINLATDPKHQDRLVSMRQLLYRRMLEERDMGLIPEPILEDLGRVAGSKYAAFLATDRIEQTQRLISVISAGENNETETLLTFTNSSDPSTRYWAAVWLGVNLSNEAHSALNQLTQDDDKTVRIAAAQALYKLGDESFLPLLIELINDSNLLVGMYALRAIEELSDGGKTFSKQIAQERDSDYEFSRRIANRLIEKWR